jgi:hypothetical protein
MGPAATDPRVVDEDVDTSGAREHLSHPARHRGVVVDVECEEPDRKLSVAIVWWSSVAVARSRKPA